MNYKKGRDRQLIMIFSTNTDFHLKVEDMILEWGYKMLVIESTGDNQSSGILPTTRQFAEPIDGDGGFIVEIITRLRPILLLFDIDSDGIPWERWVSMLSAVPATRRIPIVCIGNQTSVERLRTAKQVGAIDSVTDKDLDIKLLAIISKYARVTGESDYIPSCRQKLSEDALYGLEAFNTGKYFEAHEYLERAWMDDDTKGKDLYRALIQVSVAYYQITRGNYRGAVKMFWRVRQWIDPLPKRCRGVDVQRLRRDSAVVYNKIIQLGPNKIHEFNTKTLQPVEYEI